MSNNPTRFKTRIFWTPLHTFSTWCTCIHGLNSYPPYSWHCWWGWKSWHLLGGCPEQKRVHTVWRKSLSSLPNDRFWMQVILINIHPATKSPIVMQTLINLAPWTESDSFWTLRKVGIQSPCIIMSCHSLDASLDSRCVEIKNYTNLDHHVVVIFQYSSFHSLM